MRNRKFHQQSAATSINVKRVRGLVYALIFALGVMVSSLVLAFGPLNTARAQRRANVISNADRVPPAPPITAGKGVKTFLPTSQPMMVFAPINLSGVAKQEALAPRQPPPTEIKSIDPPKEGPGPRPGVPIVTQANEQSKGAPEAPPPSATGISPPPSQTFKGQELLGTTIPPDTGGAVGTTHVVTVTNDRVRILDRNGVVVSTVTLSSFWAGVALEGGAAVSAFDPKIMFDRFNNRYIFVSSANPQSLSSAALIAVSATSDPTGVWFRYGIDADPAATAATGRWIDYPTIGFNKNWIVVMENEFNYGAAGGGYWGPALFVIDKAVAYTGPGSLTTSVFQANFNAVCLTSATPETELACGFTMAPAITEDNTTDAEYLVEDWDNVAAQLRLSKLTGTPAAPVLTIGTQFPQSLNSWRFVAGISPTGSGGYALQRQQSAFLTSGTRVTANDSRIQNSVFRNGSLWTTHTVMLSTVPQPAGTDTSAANPHNHSAVQWWEIDPTIETGLSTPPLQRARIEDPTADNCNNNTGGTRAGCTTPQGQFFAYPHISVNQADDVLIGYTRFSERTYASAAYSFRASADAANTMRDAVVFRAGQAQYNIGGGAPFTVRWGDMSHTQTDPLNDTDFWTTQEYADVQRDVGIGIAGTWSTWWARVTPSTPAASTSGNLVISEFRLRGPQGVRDEFVELYNPGSSPLIVTTIDGSDGWALVYSPNGTTVTAVTTIPVGTVIPSKSHYLITDNQVTGFGPTLVYSLSSYANTAYRDSGGDTGYAVDNADNGGFAIFKTSNPANFAVGTRMDSVGFAGIASGLFKEGTGIPDIAASTPVSQISFNRKLTSGTPQDTNDNASDFVFVSTTAEVLTVASRLGAPGPENLDSAIQRNSTFGVSLIDPVVPGPAPPNRVRDFTSDPGNNSTFGTLAIRRTLTNNTGGPVTRLRFRMVDITTFPVAPGTADLRPRTIAGPVIVTINGPNPACPANSCIVQGTALEDPPVQTSGGGLNSTVSAGSVTLTTPIPAGSQINIQFLLGIQQTGNFRFFFNIEALP